MAKSFYHGKGGLLTVQESPWHTPVVAAFVEAGTEIGYENRDINGAFQTGFMIAQGTIRRGSRCSTAKAFLRPVRLRRNIHFSINSHVTKIAIDPVTLRADGVHFVKNGRMYYVRAKKEVILSAGMSKNIFVILNTSSWLFFTLIIGEHYIAKFLQAQEIGN